LDRLRAELESRQAIQADAAAVADAQQARLAVFKARIDRREFDLHTEASTLADERVRIDAARDDLDAKLRDAERVRAEVGDLAERQSLLDSELAELKRQREQVAAAEAHIAEVQRDMDTRAAEAAEQAAVLKARAKQVLDLQERLEADRAAVREREMALSDADGSRVSLQEQLRRRAEELSARAKQYDEQFRRVADDRAAVDQLRTELDADRIRVADELLQKEKSAEERQAALTLRTAELDDREAALARQVARLREVGAAVATERKTLADDRAKWTSERDSVVHLRNLSAAELDDLRRQVPELHSLATATLGQLTAAREVLRGQLAELHAFAEASRAEIRQREEGIEKARDEHRLAVSGFRQQVLEWQAKVGDLKASLSHGADRLDAKKSVADAAARKAEDATRELLRQQELLKEERSQVEARRTEVERHLGDLREWYRRKLRDLAAAKADLAEAPPNPALAAAQPDPGDRQLGDLLRSLDLVDADTLQALWAEARRQRRTLRHVLLSSGTVSLYQLALIEAGNLDALALGPFRVVDRLRATPRETVYRVSDPDRGLVVLRVLSDAEMQDAVRPDEFRQRFALLVAATDPHLVNVLDVLDVNGRAAAVVEWAAGLPGGDWPAVPPGVWLRLVAGAAQGLAALHRVGLAHGRLTSDAVLLTTAGEVKLQDGGLPDWLAGAARGSGESADLRMLGQLALGWATRPPADARRKKTRPFPDALLNLARRLEADAGSPMADEVPLGAGYASADDLVADLHRLFAAYPCPADDWNRLLEHVAEHHSPGQPLRKAG
jgi:hypothetical protein